MHLGNSVMKTRKVTPRCSNISFFRAFFVIADYSKNIRYIEYALFDSSTESNRTLLDSLFEIFAYLHTPTEMPRGTKSEQTCCAVGCRNSYANMNKAEEYTNSHRFQCAIAVDAGLACAPASNDGLRCIRLREIQTENYHSCYNITNGEASKRKQNGNRSVQVQLYRVKKDEKRMGDVCTPFLNVRR